MGLCYLTDIIVCVLHMSLHSMYMMFPTSLTIICTSVQESTSSFTIATVHTNYSMRLF